MKPPLSKIKAASHDARTIDVAHVRHNIVPFLHSQNVEATDKLLKHQHNPTRDFLFSVAQDHWKAHFLAIGIALDFAVHRWTLPKSRKERRRNEQDYQKESNARYLSNLHIPRFRMPVFWSDRIHFNVGSAHMNEEGISNDNTLKQKKRNSNQIQPLNIPLRFDKLFVNVASTILAHFIDTGIEFATAISNFTKQLFAAATGRRGIVNRNVVILGIDGLFHKRFVN